MADETQIAMDAAADAGMTAAGGTMDAGKAAADAGDSAAGAAAGAAAAGASNFADRAMDGARRAGEAMRASGEKISEGRSSLGLKMIEQAERNTHEAFTAMREAAKAKDMTEVMRVQAEYLRGQTSRSMEQAREIGEMIARFGREAAGPLTPEPPKQG